jgi:hypothetical protein
LVDFELGKLCGNIRLHYGQFLMNYIKTKQNSYCLETTEFYKHKS